MLHSIDNKVHFSISEFRYWPIYTFCFEKTILYTNQILNYDYLNL